jgi:hypothetical protein
MVCQRLCFLEAHLHAYLPGDAPRRAGETEQKGSENPVRQQSFALVQQGVGEITEGALAAVAPVAFASRPVVVHTPGTDVLAVATGTLQTICFSKSIEMHDIVLGLFMNRYEFRLPV